MKNYVAWEREMPAFFRDDPLWKVEAYRLGMFIADIAWYDVSKLVKDARTRKLSDQLYRAVGSIPANISEGYSRRSKKDQVRFYEYALGSAREARNWYHQGRHILTSLVVTHRLELLTKIIRLLLKMIPQERGYKIAEPKATYNTLSNPTLNTIPFTNIPHASRTTHHGNPITFP